MSSKKLQFYVFTIGLSLVFLVVFVVMINSGIAAGNPAGFLLWGANFNPYTLNNQPWRLLTAIFVHSSLFPLIFNLYSLIILGIFLEKRIGSGWFITVFILSGLFGSLASDYWNVYAISLGGNGAIFGLYGFYFSYVIADYKNNKRNLIWILVNFFIYLIMIRYFGSDSFVDDAAQLAGMATGMSMFIMYVISRKFKLSILLPVVIIAYLMVLTIGFSLIPQDQLTYFKAFRTFLKLDTQMMKSLKANYLSEKELHKNLQGLDLRWDSLLANFDSLAVFDQKVEEDKNVLRYFTKLRKEQIRLINTGIEEESFIYRDSLDLLAEKFNEIQPLNYPLNFDLSEDTDNQPVGQGLERQRLYYDSLWRETTPNNYVFYRIGYKDSLDLWSGPIRDYYKGGNIQMKGEYKAGLRNGVFLYYSPTGFYESAGQYKDDNLIGKWQYFHKNGRLKSEIMFEDRGYFLRSWDEKGNPLVVNGNGRDLTLYDNGRVKESMPYVNGIRNGESFGYHENGEMFYRERYDNGLMVYGVAIHQGQKYEYDQSVFSPHPVVGYKNLFKYLARKLKVPDAARENYIFGDLKMMFFVYQDGSIGDFKFINRLGYGCEEEAIRLITEGPEWMPVKEHGVIPVTSQARIIVKFPYSEK